MGKTLRVLAKGTASVPNHAAHAGGRSEFIGRFNDETLGTPYEHEDSPGVKRMAIMPARVPHAMPTVLDQDVVGHAHWAEYFKNVREGDLWAADEETARMCGVDFDPKFGGEYSGSDGKLVCVAHKAAQDALKAKPAPVAPPAPAPVPDTSFFLPPAGNQPTKEAM